MAGVVDGPYNACEFMSFSRKGNGPDFVEPLGRNPSGSFLWVLSGLLSQPAFNCLPRPPKQPPGLHGLGELAPFRQFPNVLRGAAEECRYLGGANEAGR